MPPLTSPSSFKSCEQRQDKRSTRVRPPLEVHSLRRSRRLRWPHPHAGKPTKRALLERERPDLLGLTSKGP